LDDNTVDEIFASHILEHTTFKEDALAEWCRVLKPGGKITVCVPDLMQMLAHYRAGIIPLDNFYASIYGNQITGDTRPGMEHFQVFTVDMLVERMRTHFRDVKQASEGMPRQGYFGEAIAQGYKA
jgi:predicted SAM-dependent methyltransferase